VISRIELVWREADGEGDEGVANGCPPVYPGLSSARQNLRLGGSAGGQAAPMTAPNSMVSIVTPDASVLSGGATAMLCARRPPSVWSARQVRLPADR
jgi:hypothetical protein